MNGLDKSYADMKRIKGVRWLLLWVMLTQFVCKVVVSAVVSFIPEPSENFARYAAYIQQGIVTVLTFLIPIIVYSMTAWRKTERADAEEMRFNKFPVWLTGWIALMAVSGQFVMILLNIPVLNIMGGSSKALVPITYGEVFAAIAVTAVLPGVFEEFWMRGIVLSVYERRSTFVAIVFTTIMFGLLHGSLTKLPGVIFLGFVAAVITIRVNSVYGAMLYHILNNTTSVIFGYVLAHYKIGDAFLWTFVIVMALVFVASFVCFLVILPKRKRKKCNNEGVLLFKSFLSLPVILCLIIVILKIKFGT